MLINLIVYSCLAVAFLNAAGNAIDGRRDVEEWVPWTSAAIAIIFHPLITAIASSSQHVIVAYSKSPFSEAISRDDYISIMAAFAVIAISAFSRVIGKLVWWTAPVALIFMCNLAVIEAMTPKDGRRASMWFILPFVFVAIVLYMARPWNYARDEMVTESDMPKAVHVGKTTTN